MKNVISKIISVLLASVIVAGAMPVFAAEVPAAPVVSLVADKYGDYSLKWNETTDYGKYNIYKSTDGVNFSLNDSTYSNSYDIYTSSKELKHMLYYYVTAVDESCDCYDYDLEDYDNYIDCDFTTTTAESQPSNIVSMPCYISETVYAYSDFDNDKLTIRWYQSRQKKESADKYFDGYVVYMATGNAKLKQVAKIPAKSYKKATKNEFRYEYKAPGKLKPGEYRFLVATYTVINGVTYITPDYDEAGIFSVYMESPKLTVKTNSVKLKWQKATGVDSYIIKQSVNDKAYKSVATVSSKCNTYTVKNIDTYKKSYSYYIVGMKNGKKVCTSYSSYCDDSELRFKGAKKLKNIKSTVDVVNTRTKQTTKAWTVTITKADKETLDNWTKKNFKKGWSDYEKISYALNWINSKVTYAYDGSYNKIASCTYVDAIFNKRLGQCLQYNGAAAMLLTYMGYDVRIVQGWRGTGMDNKWSHYWCEIKIDGRWYLVETGNHQDGLSPRFAIPYRQTSGYMLNQKVAK